MRYFKLINSKGIELDITTRSIFFHDLSGLGFEEDTIFRRVGESWWLSKAEYKQSIIKGKISFTSLEGEEPYNQFLMFSKYVSRAPLTLLYYPCGLDGTEYRRTVRVTKLAKSELNKFGALEDEIEFTAYTPWYERTMASNADSMHETTRGWVWGGNDNPPLVFEPTNPEYTVTRFGSEPVTFVNLYSPINSLGPVKLTIYGPASNPTWLQYVGSTRIASGRFSLTENVEIAEGTKLVIDNTSEQSSMKILTLTDDFVMNVYPLRDFDTRGFFNLREGYNTISVLTQSSNVVRFDAEGYVYYATV